MKVIAQVIEKGKISHFGAALDFKPGVDLNADPLRCASVWAVAMLDDHRMLPRVPQLV